MLHIAMTENFLHRGFLNKNHDIIQKESHMGFQ